MVDLKRVRTGVSNVEVGEKLTIRSDSKVQPVIATAVALPLLLGIRVLIPVNWAIRIEAARIREVLW